jgi:hypothetical protein
MGNILEVKLNVDELEGEVINFDTEVKLNVWVSYYNQLKL